MFNTILHLAQQAPELPPPPEQGIWPTLITIGIAVIFFYVILWRPEAKRRKELDQRRSSLKQGDRVIAMGVVGTVVRCLEETVIIKMHDGSKLEFIKGAVSDILPEEKASS